MAHTSQNKPHILNYTFKSMISMNSYDNNSIMMTNQSSTRQSIAATGQQSRDHDTSKAKIHRFVANIIILCTQWRAY